jgi:hypothetical protein
MAAPSSLRSNQWNFAMLYALLCYHSEDVVFSWTKERDDAVLAKLAVVQEARIAFDEAIARAHSVAEAAHIRMQIDRLAKGD